jgi:hypothetical protein
LSAGFRDGAALVWDLARFPKLKSRQSKPLKR